MSSMALRIRVITPTVADFVAFGAVACGMGMESDHRDASADAPCQLTSVPAA
jgi:hypothetical protein